MKASEARVQAQKNLETKVDKSLSKVLKNIGNRVNQGKFHYYHYDFLSEFAKKELIGLGYEISSEGNDVGGEYTYKISW